MKTRRQRGSGIPQAESEAARGWATESVAQPEGVGGNRRRKTAAAKSGANTRTRYQGNFLITEKQNANGDGWTVISLEASPGRNNKVAPNQSGRPKSRRRGKSSPGAPATKKKGATPASQMLANLNAGGAYSNVTPQQKAASRRKYGRGTLAGL